MIRQLLRQPFQRLTILAVSGVVILASACENLDYYGGGDEALPSTPTALVAAPASSSRINLNWTPSTDNMGVAGYRIYRGGVQIATSTGNAYGDEGLSANSTHTYMVAAYDSAGNVSPASNPATATTFGAGVTDTDPPTAPAVLVAVPASSSTIALTWAPSTDNAGVLGYRIFRGGVEIGTSSTLLYTDTGLSAATAYTYTVAAFDAAGNLSAHSNPATATTLGLGGSDTQAPTVPLALVAIPASSSSIALTWTPSIDNSGVLGYQIFRNGTQIATSAVSLYTDTGLAASTSYTYTVAAYDAAGNVSAQSAPATATTLGAGASDTDPPTVPLALVALPASSSSIALTWTPSVDNVGVLGYRVFRGGAEVGTSTLPLFTDAGLSANTAYTYTVAAYDAAGNESAESGPVSATTLPSGTGDIEPPTIPTGGVAVALTPGSVSITWNASTDNVGVLGYWILRDGVEIGSSATQTFTDLGLSPLTLYAYTIVAFDAAGNSSAASVAASVTTPNITINLGTAANFAVLGGTSVTIGGTPLNLSVITGDLGTSPANSITGLANATITGTVHAGDAAAATAQVDLATAYNACANLITGSGNDLSGQDLGGKTLTAGVYDFAASASLNGTLTLNGQGNANAMFVIKMGGDLNAVALSQVVLTNGAQAGNICWQVGGTATVGAGATIRGNLLALSSINLGLSAQLQGRALARTGGVGLNVNIVGL